MQAFDKRHYELPVKHYACLKVFLQLIFEYDISWLLNLI